MTNCTFYDSLKIIKLVEQECNKGLGNRRHLVEKLKKIKPLRGEKFNIGESNEIITSLVENGFLVPGKGLNWEFQTPLSNARNKNMSMS